MDIIKRDGKWKLFDGTTALILMDETSLDRIIENPSQPLISKQDKGYSEESYRLYDTETSLVDICEKGKSSNAKRLEVSYDFFFGGSRRENYPDSSKTIKAYKVIHDLAKEHGMDFGASIVSPLDTGGGYACKHNNTGKSYQYKESRINPDGSYDIDMILQTQWTNNKGPIGLKIERVLVYSFNEERIGETPLYYVDPDNITDISATAHYEIDQESIKITSNGYGSGKIRVLGNALKSDKNRCIAVIAYKTPELDYFSEDALPYMKSVIDLHYESGITYDGFYSDEMHIQFDWDLFNHFGHDTEINTRYLTESLAKEYSKRYGGKFQDLVKYLVYFSYHQHDFIEGPEGKLPSQHVFGRDEKGIYDTWLFRKRYFEILQRRVVDLCLDTKKYAEQLFGKSIMAKGHSTWQEAPTCDRFHERARFSEYQSSCYSRYDYTPDYVWSSSIRENTAACYDYFKWNEYLTGGGTDHPEGGYLDRNYYGCAFACSLAALNKYTVSYYGFWGGPKPVMQALGNIGIAYGNHSLGYDLRHNIVQNLSPRLTDVLTLYPLDLNYVEERFGSWMIQYGYTNYITEDELLKNYKGCNKGRLSVKEEEYRTLVIIYSPFITKGTLDIIEDFLKDGGRVIWSSVYPLARVGRDDLIAQWKRLFDIEECYPAYLGKTAKGSKVHFINLFSGVKDMEIPTDMLPDFIYPVKPAESTMVIAEINNEIIGTYKEYENGGAAVYLGFRPRDDQSCSTGRDIDTLFSVLRAVKAYEEGSLEVVSRESGSKFLVNRFKNGAVSLTNHIREYYEEWDGKFFRNAEEDEMLLAERELPKANIELKKFQLNGCEINYSGRGVLTVNIDEKGTLKGFAGENTTGIEVNGQAYRFCDIPCDIAWSEIHEGYLCEGIERAFAVFANQTGTLLIPVGIEDSNAYRAAVCKQDLFDIEGHISLDCGKNGVTLNIDENEKGKWILLYKCVGDISQLLAI